MKKLIVLLIEFEEKAIVFSKRILKISYQYILKSSKKSIVFIIKHKKKFTRLGGFLMVLFTLYMALKPVISISPTEPRIGQNIFTSYFTIKNNGNSSVEITKVNFVFDDVILDNDIRITGYELVGYCEKIDLIKPNSSQTLNCNILENIFDLDPLETKTWKAEIIIIVSYKYWTFFKRTKYFPFHTSEIRYGNIIWLEGH